MPPHSETLYSIVTDPEATMTRVRVMQKMPPRELVTEAEYRRALEASPDSSSMIG